MRSGAGDYVTKPFDMGVLPGPARTQLLRPVVQCGTAVLGVSRQMLDVERLLRRMARLSAPVLLTGETGSARRSAHVSCTASGRRRPGRSWP